MNYRIVQLSPIRFGLERKHHYKRHTGWLWWRKVVHLSEWRQWGWWRNPKGSTLIGGYVLPGRDERKTFESETEAQAYLDGFRALKDYPKVIKEPA